LIYLRCGVGLPAGPGVGLVCQQAPVWGWSGESQTAVGKQQSANSRQTAVGEKYESGIIESLGYNLCSTMCYKKQALPGISQQGLFALLR